MNIKHLHFFFLVFLFPLFGFSQETKCGLDQHDIYGIEYDETTQRNVDAIEELSQEWISNLPFQAQTRDVITIPVVVHVVWENESENFSDLEVQAQIDALTADFRKLNSNTNLIPPLFQDLAADTEIEFCIANIDANGIPRKGIIRKQTSITNIGTRFNGQLRICHTNQGGSDAWDPEKYVNIWVGQLDVIAGRATLPGTASSVFEDGIWIDPNAFGFVCTTSSGLNMGRTLTHEMGHYFNLQHLWGEGGCNSTDLVNDTPNQETFSSGCPSHPKVSCGTEDMFMNFMDYTNDACLAMFTHGQKERMLSVIIPENSFRHTLLSSNGCGLIEQVNRTLTPDGISIFPNPAKDCIHIDLDMDNNLPLKMIIYNTMGQAISISNVFAKDLRTLDITNLSNGVYFIYFESNNQSASKKLIIDK